MGRRRTTNVKKHAEKFDDADWDEKPAHRVTITQPFHMAATEVTLGQYRAIRAGASGERQDEDAAVNGISWERGGGVLRVAVGEGRQDLSPADRGGVGVCLPRGHDDAVSHRRCAAGGLSPVADRHRPARALFPEDKLPPEYPPQHQRSSRCGSRRRRRMRGACSTCTATSPSGARTGMGRMKRASRPIRSGAATATSA